EVAEGKAQLGEEFAAFRVGRSGGDENQVEADLALDLVEFDFREDGLVVETNGVVSASVERLRGDTAEVADVRRGDVDEAVEEFPHAGTTKGDTCSEGFTLAELEVGDSLLRVGDGRLLSGDLANFDHGVVDSHLAVRGLAHAGGDDDFL